MKSLYFIIARFETDEEIKNFWEALAPAGKKIIENYEWCKKEWISKYADLDPIEQEGYYWDFHKCYEDATEALDTLLTLIKDILTVYEIDKDKKADVLCHQIDKDIKELENDSFYVKLWEIVEKYR